MGSMKMRILRLVGAGLFVIPGFILLASMLNYNLAGADIGYLVMASVGLAMLFIKKDEWF